MVTAKRGTHFREKSSTSAWNTNERHYTFLFALCRVRVAEVETSRHSDVSFLTVLVPLAADIFARAQQCGVSTAIARRLSFTLQQQAQHMKGS